jgi:hypothetical protein
MTKVTCAPKLIRRLANWRHNGIMVIRSSCLSNFVRIIAILLRRAKCEFQSGRRRVFSGFWTKRVTCCARESLSINLDGIN